ncbi:c-type cytochrome [Aromatoleum diolicum]|uniref:C-type cytochrome n=1 Tax=Aromatoleum diolicum TaxID=75796 RepID=A0ABX1QJD5_9RHOO|nr:c-type cytochrome [Aromatoleum diolicum]
MNQNKQFRQVMRASVIGLGVMASFAANAGPIKADVLYHEYCSVCHGDRGDGNSKAVKSLNPPPRDLTTAGASLPRDYILHVITHGKPGTAMVGYKTRLNSDQLAALADYVHTDIINRGAAISAGTISGISGTSGTTSGTPGAPSAAPGQSPRHGAGVQSAPTADGAPIPPIAAPIPPSKPVAANERADMTAPFPSGLKGDAAKGKAFYNANCAECHGVKGDGKGPRAYFIRPVPRNFGEERSRLTLNRPAIYAATFFGRNGTEMPAWSKVLTEQEIANVSEFVFQNFIQSDQKAAKAK